VMRTKPLRAQKTLHRPEVRAKILLTPPRTVSLWKITRIAFPLPSAEGRADEFLIFSRDL
jgi:hypothetical protein